jgi:sec-independent protein translocase protein TatA
MLSPIVANLFESPIGLLVILVIALLFFGHKLPNVARSLGSSVSEFKKGVKAGEDDAETEADAEKKAEADKKVEAEVKK